jgi:hypothetical protein
MHPGRILKLLVCAALALPQPFSISLAAEPELDAIQVTAMRNPVAKSYRRMVDGMDLFERQRAMAPEATLRYRLLPRRRDTDMRRISLAVLGDSVTIPVRIEADGSFLLERDEKALREDATVMPDRRAGTMTWRTEIRSPGLPPDTRRLGDLRLECEVGMEADLVSNRRSLLSNSMRRRLGYCGENPARYLYFTERPLFGVTLVSGARRESLPVDELYAGSTRQPLDADDLATCDCEVMLDRTYFLPLGDASWPDDTLVQFDYMEPSPPTDYAGRTGADMRAALGEPLALRFDNRYEVWVYRGKETKDPKARNELVLLLDASGAVVKSRLRAGVPAQ